MHFDHCIPVSSLQEWPIREVLGIGYLDKIDDLFVCIMNTQL